MAKKSKDKTFHNPFSHLKGFSVPDRPAEKAPAKPQPQPQPVIEVTEENFSSAMEALGVKKIATDSERLPHTPSPPAPAPAPDTTPVHSDVDEFLSALGALDVRFQDEIPEEPATASAARRMRQLRRGKILIEGEVDLHGLTRVEALEKFRFFLVDAKYQGWQTVRVITGQGLHSSDAPVVRDAIEDLLRREAPAEILEWERAPQRHGGQGALILFLRKGS